MIRIAFWLKILLVMFIITASTIAYIIYYYASELPDYSYLANYNPPAVTRIYSIDGKLIEEYAWEHRVFVPIGAIPRSLKEAFIAAEDKNFYKHYGVDLVSFTRAAIRNTKNVLLGKRVEGGSTITQQVVKNFLLGSERSLARKIKEAILSYMITKTFTKDQILELYLNQVFLGKGAYGVAIAAQNYFNKSIEELNLAESAFIAGLTKAPSNFDPARNYKRSKERRDYVILRMLEEGYISKSSALNAINSPLELKKRDKLEGVSANYFANEVMSQIIDMLGKDVFYAGGLTVITSIDSNYQTLAENVFREHIREYDKTRGYRGPITKIPIKLWQKELQAVKDPEGLLEYKIAVVLQSNEEYFQLGFKDGNTDKMLLEDSFLIKSTVKTIKSKPTFKVGDVIVVDYRDKKWHLAQIPDVNGAVIVMNPNTGQILAMVGGYDYNNSKFNRATQAQRQPGSLIKSFVYLAALENGVLPNSIFYDNPVEIFQGYGLPLWRPKNYKKGSFSEPMTLRRGLERSNNIVTVKIAQKVGISKIAEIIQRFGINENPKKVYSIVLGSLETTLDKITSAYCSFANGGKLVVPEYIELIKDRNGKILYKRDKNICYNCISSDVNTITLPKITLIQPKQIVDEATSYQVNSILVGAIQRGTGFTASKIGKIMGGKTGTSNNSMDTWFIGFTPKLIVGTYVGYDTPKSLGTRATGSTVALPIYTKFMTSLLKNEPSLPFIVPPTIKFVKVDYNTGRPVGSNEPGIMEAFKIGDDPFQYYHEEYDGEE